MKKYNIFKVVLISILVAALLTWVLPTASFQNELVESARSQVGIFDIFSYPLIAISYFSYIFLYVLAIGIFYGVLSKTKVYGNLVSKIAKTFKNKEKLFLSILVAVIAIIISVTGLTVPLLVVVPFVIALVLAMGYSKITGALIVLGSYAVGFLGTTFGTGNILYLNSVLVTTVFDGILIKVIILVLGLGILIFNILTRLNKEVKVKEDNKEYFIPEVEKTTKKSWPLIVILALTFIVMVLAYIPWKDVFGLTIFTDATTAVTTFAISGFPIFDKILGTVNAFGSWSLNEITILLMISAIIIALVYKIKTDEFISGALKGMKKAIYPAFIMTLTFVILVLVTYNPFQNVIYKFLLGLTKGFNSITMAAVALLSSIFNVEFGYVSQSTLPYVASVITDTGLYPLIGIIFQSIYGVVLFAGPTSFILLGILSYLGISYKDWLKNTWKIILELLLLLIIVFIIVSII